MEVLLESRIVGLREISTRRDNPMTLLVLDIENGSSLVIGHESDEMSPLYHCFYITREGKDNYSEGGYLFNPDWKNYVDKNGLRKI